MKSEFLHSKEWKEFTKNLKSKQKIDPITGSKIGKRAACHHLCPSRYEDLNEDNFIILNVKSHECVEFIRHSKSGWKHAIYEIIKICEKMDSLC